MNINSEYYLSVLDRAKEALNATTDEQLAKALGLKSRTTISESRKRGTVPHTAITRTALNKNGLISLDFIYGIKKTNEAVKNG